MQISIHPKIADLEPRIKLFVEAMVYKLYKNADKGAWEDLDIDDAFARLREETVELEEAIDRSSNIEIMMEAADIANFAMIVADIATDKGQRR